MTWSNDLVASLRPEGDLPGLTSWRTQIQALVNILPDLAVIMERSGRIVAVNSAFAKRVGLTPDCLADSDIFDLITSPAESARTYLRRCTGSRQRLPGALAFRMVDGHEMPCRCDGAAMPMMDPGAPPLLLLHCRPRAEAQAPFTRLKLRLAALTREIRARRMAETAMRESERRFRELLGALPAAVYTTDSAGRITYYNQAAVDLAGRRPTLGSDEWCVTWRLYWPDGRPMRHDECPMAVALKEDRPIRGEEAVAERPDGTRVPFIPYPTPLHDSSGALVGAVNMLVDISERKRAEAALREVNEALEQRVEERTRALEAEMRERRKAETALWQAQRLEAIGQLTGGVAHDFNNLLTVVTGNLDLMRKLAEGGAVPTDALRRLIEGTQRAAARGTRLTKQLLAFSRQGSVQPAVVELQETIASFASFLQRVVGETVELRLDFTDGRLNGKLDPAQFEAAVLNLAVNARDAMPKGGTLTIKTARVTIGAAEASEILREGAYAVVAVSDTGVGMPSDIAERVFEPFFTTKEVGKGGGLGLAQVWGFAKQSGGHAAIESEPGVGTTVKLFLPESNEAPETAAAQDARPERRGSETILVVEDDAFVREVTVETLRSLGYATVVACDGREALAALQHGEPIDLLFTDYVMPGGLSGAELAQEARRLRPDLKVLLTSGYARHARQDGPSAKDFPIIGKPYRRLDLAETIRTVLAGVGPVA